MRIRVRACCLCAAALSTLAPAVAHAQEETRASIIAEAQAAKARALAPHTPSKAERFALSLKRQLFEFPDGFYPWTGSVYSGGGFTLGAGYRRYFGDHAAWTARGLLSAKGYKLAELMADGFRVADGRVTLQAIGGWRDATQVSFYGVGGDTSPDAKSNFQMKQAYGGVSVRARGPAASAVEAGFRVEDFTLDPGHGTSPSIEDAFTNETAPGLDADPTYFHTTLSGGIDTRPSAGYARRGGLYALTYDAFADRDDVYSFEVLQAEVVQHVPILRENWVLSFHGVAQTTLDNDSTVPYFLMPSLGSGSTLRAYPSWRFRDRHSLLLSGEWRWIPNPMFLDVAIFYDAGKVVSRREDLNFAGLTHNWGLGVRFHGPAATPLRVEIAHGREGFHLVFSGGPAF
jgi:hypothetical protein